MRGWWLSLVLLLAVVPVLAQTKPAPAQADDNVIRLTTDLVVLDTQVIAQANGKIIGGLKAEDFIVEEDGIKQEISFFAQDKLPLSVVLLFDLTDTVQPVLQELAKGALQSLQHFKPEDELAVLVYAQQVRTLQGFTRERAPVAAAIEQAAGLHELHQLALFNEALFQASAYLHANAAPRTRRVILWLTDNLPNKPPKSAHSEDEAFAQLFEHDIAVFGLMLQSASGKVYGFFELLSGGKKGAGDIFKYAKRSGGEVIKAEQENVNQRLAEIVDRVRARYTLGYVSTNTSAVAGFRRLRVRVTPAIEKREGKVILRGKTGYFAKQSPTK